MSRYRPELYCGGHAQPSGSIHVSFRSGSRRGGASAASSYDYITREREYDQAERDPALYTESGHMPEWAQEDPHAYWDAADLYERANGRLYVSADFALPRDLDLGEQIELARDFAQSLTDDERLPYTLAIHAGRDDEGNEHNPHAHLMFSERGNDGFSRDPSDWFSRADSEHPERGGAPKSREFHGREWVEEARQQWADLTNELLERKGRPERVDHRSYARQGLDLSPGRHFGPSAPHRAARGEEHERLEDAVAGREREGSLDAINREIAQLEAVRTAIIEDERPEHRREPEARDHSNSSGGDSDRDDDRSWGR